MKRTTPRRRATPTPPQPRDSFLLTPEQVAARLGLRVKTLHNWRQLAKGPRGLKVGRYVRYRAADLDEWVRDQVDADEDRRSS